MSPLEELREHGQAIWLDFIRREMLHDGELARLIRDDGLSGVTSNPAIFEKAIAGGGRYDVELRRLLAEDAERPVVDLYERLAITDIRMAADLLAGVHRETDGADGFVSLEVSPHLAADTLGTIAEAQRLWAAVDRPNLMIKVPATEQGIPAIEELLAQGIHVNITLMFSLDHYEAVASAFLRGVERAMEPGRAASVASFFVSRVDSLVDRRLAEVGGEEAEELAGTIAVANSKVTYARFREIFEGERFAELAARGARPQRVLWASTSTKNPDYRDVLYVEELIGPHTVNTMPPDTLDAFRDHGRVRQSLGEGLDEARRRLERLEALGIDFDEVTEELQREGVEKFVQPFDRLLATLEQRRDELRAGAPAADAAGRSVG